MNSTIHGGFVVRHEDFLLCLEQYKAYSVSSFIDSSLILAISSW